MKDNNTYSETEKIVMRIRYRRGEKISYLGHLDMMRMFERAVRRAGIKPEYTKGFNPRPILSFALPSGVGVESLDEYFDICLSEAADSESIVDLLNQNLPQGVEVFSAEEVDSSGKSLMAEVTACEYLFIYPGIGKFCKIINDSDVLKAEKYSKGKVSVINVKDYIISFYSDSTDCLSVKVKSGSKENLRPDLLLKSFEGFEGFSEKDALGTRIIKKKVFF